MQRVDDLPEVEVGYLFLRKYWGQGLATEAARASHDYGINQLGYSRLISLIDPRNIASKRVAEKIGMAFEKETFMFNKRLCVYAYQSSANAT
jgi:ribosomal-protein-alanine N-acetyltransferase